MKLIILDRDGVINQDRDDFVKSVDEWIPIECRKPKPGMIIDIIERFKANAAETWLVGDSLRDLQAIDAAGGKSALVLTGKGKKTLAKHEQDLPEHTQVFDNLLAFSQYIMRKNTQIEEAAQAIL